jgi:hypothetical protein
LCHKRVTPAPFAHALSRPATRRSLWALLHDFDDLASSCDRNSAKTCRTPADEGGLDIPRSSVVVDPWRWKVCARCADEGREEPAGGEGCRCKVAAWRAQWRDPAGRSRSKVFVRKLDASAHLAHAESAKARGTYVDPASGRQRFDDFAEDWAVGQDWKASTRDAWPYIAARAPRCRSGSRTRR